LKPDLEMPFLRDKSTLSQTERSQDFGGFNQETRIYRVTERQLDVFFLKPKTGWK